jgi:hypothetical protein
VTLGLWGGELQQKTSGLQVCPVQGKADGHYDIK